MAKKPKKATPADYASVEFEPVLGLAEAMGSRAEWLTKMETRYVTLYLGAATLAKTPEQLATMATAQPDATVELMKCVNDLSEKLAAESEIMRTAEIRLMAGCCRAGLL